MTETVAHNTWEEVGVRAHTKPTKHRPATSYQAYAGAVTLYGTAYRAVVIHSSTQDKRRQQRLERDIQASYSTAQSAARRVEQQAYLCRADAEAAAAQLRAVPAPYHLVDVTVEEQPVYGRGRPSADKPRPISAMRYRLKTAINPQIERIARLEEEAGCFGLRTNVPTVGELAHSARAFLTVDKDQQGTEPNYGFLKNPVLGNRLFLKKPERIEALGLILLLALLLWRLMERAMRAYVDTSRTPLPGWDKQATERPTAFMMITKFAGVIVMKLGSHRQLARPLSGVQQQSLMALDVSVTCFTLPTGSQRTAMAARRLSRRQKHILQWLATDYQRTRGMITSSHQDLGQALPGDKGNMSPRLQTLEACGLIVISRPPGGKAESVCSLWRVRNGPHNSQEGVIKKKAYSSNRL